MHRFRQVPVRKKLSHSEDGADGRAETSQCRVQEGSTDIMGQQCVDHRDSSTGLVCGCIIRIPVRHSRR